MALMESLRVNFHRRTVYDSAALRARAGTGGGARTNAFN